MILVCFIPFFHPLSHSSTTRAVSIGAGRGIRTPEAHKGHGLALMLALKAPHLWTSFHDVNHTRPSPAEVSLKPIPI